MIAPRSAMLSLGVVPNPIPEVTVSSSNQERSDPEGGPSQFDNEKIADGTLRCQEQVLANFFGMRQALADAPRLAARWQRQLTAHRFLLAALPIVQGQLDPTALISTLGADHILLKYFEIIPNSRRKLTTEAARRIVFCHIRSALLPWPLAAAVTLDPDDVRFRTRTALVPIAKLTAQPDGLQEFASTFNTRGTGTFLRVEPPREGQDEVEGGFITTEGRLGNFFTASSVRFFDLPTRFPRLNKPQTLVVRSMLRNLIMRRHALLESPTGTGKTLALLTGALAYQDYVRSRRLKPPLIIYAARTHSQLDQTIEEFKRSPWDVRMSILGAMRHCCPFATGSEVPDGLDTACRDSRKVSERHRNRYDSNFSSGIKSVLTDTDIESLYCGRPSLLGPGAKTDTEGLTKRRKRKLHGDFEEEAENVLISRESVTIDADNQYRDFLDKMSERRIDKNWPGGGCPFYLAMGDMKQVARLTKKFGAPDRPELVVQISEGGDKLISNTKTAGESLMPVHHGFSFKDLVRAAVEPLLHLFPKGSRHNALLDRVWSKGIPPLRSVLERFDNLRGDGETVLDGSLVGPCPMYMSRGLLQDAEIVFMPYNYLLDPSLFSRLIGDRVNEAIVLVDEAHNIEGQIRDELSGELSFATIRKALPLMLHFGDDEFARDEVRTAFRKAEMIVRRLWDHLIGLTCRVGSRSVWGDAADEKTFIPMLKFGPGWPQCFDAATPETLLNQTAEEGIRSAVTYMETFDVSAGGRRASLSTLPPSAGLQKWETPDRIFDEIKSFLSLFHLGIQNPKVFCLTLARRETEWKVSLNCLSASVGIDRLATSARSLFLASGTLTPRELFKDELGEKWLERLAPDDENGGSITAEHVINPWQLAVLPMRTVINARGEEVSFTTTKRGLDRRKIYALGLTLVEILSAIPGGVLMFFPSYAMLDQCMGVWNSECVAPRQMGFRYSTRSEPQNALIPGTRILKAMGLVKGAYFREPRRATTNHREDADGTERQEELMRRNFEDCVKKNGNGLVFAVYRGKFSEGMSLADEFCRGVICIGLPLPNYGADGLRTKMTFNDYMSESSERYMKGEAYYNNQAWVAVNQAIGRVIRHHNDKGVALLLDERFDTQEGRAKLARWLVPFIAPNTRGYRTSTELHPMLQQFFAS